MKEIPAHIRVPQWRKIKKVEKESVDIKTYYLVDPKIAKAAQPGQFFMIYIFNYMDEPEEAPISVSYIGKKTIGISVKAVGPRTKALHQHSKAQGSLQSLIMPGFRLQMSWNKI